MTDEELTKLVDYIDEYAGLDFYGVEPGEAYWMRQARDLAETVLRIRGKGL